MKRFSYQNTETKTKVFMRLTTEAENKGCNYWVIYIRVFELFIMFRVSGDKLNQT